MRQRRLIKSYEDAQLKPDNGNVNLSKCKQIFLILSFTPVAHLICTNKPNLEGKSSDRLRILSKK